MKPFIKWVGGKTQLVPELLNYVPPNFISNTQRTYFEPFLGGGAFLLALLWRYPASFKAVASDINGQLINCWNQIQCNLDKLVAELEQATYPEVNERQYYSIRGLDYSQFSWAFQAARFIVLNKCCFNGLYRENSKGIFNSPWCHKVKTRDQIFNAEQLQELSEALIDHCMFNHNTYEQSVITAVSGDFVYFDPPYHPVSTTANFTAYNKSGFGTKDQERLHDVAKSLAASGVSVMLSNSDCEFIRNLYKDLNIHFVQATRRINSDANGRGKVGELLITSY